MAAISVTTVAIDPVVIDNGSLFVAVQNPKTSNASVRVAINGSSHVLAPGITARYESGGFPVTVESVGKDVTTIRHDGNRLGDVESRLSFPIVDAIRLTQPTESWATAAGMYGPRRWLTPDAFDQTQAEKRRQAAEVARVNAEVNAANERNEAQRTAAYR